MSVSVLASPSSSASSVAGPDHLVVPTLYQLSLLADLPSHGTISNLLAKHIPPHIRPARDTTSKAKPRRPKAPSSYAKAVTKEDVPEEGTIEWRAQNFDESQRAAAERLIQQARDAAAKLAEESNNVGPNAASAASVAAANIASKVDSASSNVASAPMDDASFRDATAVKPLSKVSSIATEDASKAFANIHQGPLIRNKRHIFCRVRLLLRSEVAAKVSETRRPSQRHPGSRSAEDRRRS
ncbi:hypothetical protein CF326_g2371 [Tilletia indica]|nr:hypothetical protein CF326_g2371 [Tilletia indica]